MTTPGITKRIGSIKFSCVSPEEIRKMSATKVITADTYDEEGYPIEMGLMDPHMGVIEPGLRCKTCGCKVDECPGHFGHIDLAMPVIHVGFIKDIHPRRVHQGHQDAPGVHLLQVRQADALRGPDPGP